MTTPLFAGPGQGSAKHVQDPLEGGPRTPLVCFASKGGVNPHRKLSTPHPRIAHAKQAPTGRLQAPKTQPLGLWPD